MSGRDHDKHVVDGVNKDVDPLETIQQARERYLGMLGNWTDPYGPPVVKVHDGVRVVRDDLITGTKCRGGDLLLSRVEKKTVVYVQPRVGLAGVSILECAKRHDKDVVLFMPASKRISHHQACTIERGARPMFKRIAAMPVLNFAAKAWAEENDAEFVPLGLKHPLVTAGIMRAAMEVDEPERAYVATSTGVLTRALQLAWPKTEFVSVCVARNMKAGELGRAFPITEPLPFAKEISPEKAPPFPSVLTYDAKVWPYVKEAAGRIYAPENILMWNVGKEPVLHDLTIFDRVGSDASW